MPFTLVKRHSFPATVAVEVESDSKPGSYITQTFGVRLEKLDQVDYETVMDQIKSEDLSVRSLLERVLVEVEGVNDEAGKPVAFDVAKPALLDDTTVCTALFTAFVEGQLRAKGKNSKK